MEHEIETVERESEQRVEQEILRLKHLGRSIREIAEAVGKPPTTVHRILSKAGIAENGTAVEQPVEHFDALIAETVQALATDDLDVITAALATIEREEKKAAAALQEAQDTAQEAQRRVETVAVHVAGFAERLSTADAVDRVGIEVHLAQSQTDLDAAKADLTAAAAIVRRREYKCREYAPLLTRLRRRKAALQQAAAQREVTALLEQTRQRLARAKQAFLDEIRAIESALPSIATQAQAAGLSALSEQAILTNMFQRVQVVLAEIEAFNIGSQSIDGHARVRVTLKRPWCGHEAGAVITTPQYSALGLWRDGFIEKPEFQLAGRQYVA